MSAVLVCDCGGTNTRTVLCRSIAEITKTPLKSVENSNYSTMLAAVSDTFDPCASGVEIAGAVIAVAGPVIDEQVTIVNAKGVHNSRAWPRSSTKLFSDWLSGKPVLFVNDLEASLRGILWLKRYRQLVSKAIRGIIDYNANKILGLVVPGTGLGLAFGFGAELNWQIKNSELAHWCWRRSDQENAKMVERRIRLKHGERRLSIEQIVSGPGLSLVFDCFCEEKGLNVLSIPGAMVMEIANGKIINTAAEGHISAAYDSVCFLASELGQYAAMHAMAVNASGGVIFAGEIVESMISLVGTAELISGFDGCDWGAGLLNSIPMTVVSNRHLPLVGAMAMWNDFHNYATNRL